MVRCFDKGVHGSIQCRQAQCSRQEVGLERNQQLDERILSIQEPDAFHIVDDSGRPSRGCDQDWYGSEWQRASGCGPSVASGILYYLHRTKRIHLPFDVDGKSDCIGLMESVWKHVTPTSNGVDTVERFRTGVQDFARSIGQALLCRTLEIPSKKADRPDLGEMTRFLASGLRLDCPVAFLNLSSGRVRKIESWHWMTIVALKTGPESDDAQSLIFDGTASIWIDLAKWHATSALGGGFVYFESVG